MILAGLEKIGAAYTEQGPSARAQGVKPPTDMAAQAKGRRELARLASGTTIPGAQKKMAVLMAGAKASAAVSNASAGGLSAGVPSMGRKPDARTPIPPVQPKVASLEVFQQFAKAAAMNDVERQRQQHAYYAQNRELILQKNRTYRAKNSAEIRRRNAIYRRKVKMGVQRQRQRVETGGHGYVFGGYR